MSECIENLTATECLIFVTIQWTIIYLILRLWSWVMKGITQSEDEYNEEYRMKQRQLFGDMSSSNRSDKHDLQ